MRSRDQTFGQKGSKARRAAFVDQVRSRPHDRHRRRRYYPLYLPGPETVAIAAIVGFRETAGCLRERADIFL